MIVRSFRVVMTKEAIITPSFKKKKKIVSNDAAEIGKKKKKKVFI